MNSVLSCIEVFLTDGLMYSLLAMGFYISFSILDFPDLSVEGTVLLGGVSYSLLVCAGLNPWLAIIIAFICGAAAGSVTGILHVKLKIRPLLCGILVSTALISVNLVVAVVGMGGTFKGDGALSTVSFARTDQTVLRAFPANLIPDNVKGISLRGLIVFLVLAIVFKLILDWYLKTKNGLLLRATGNNAQFVSMLAQDPGKSKIIGLAIANGYAAVAGALIATSRGNANQGMGIGMVVIGLASVIIGLSVFGKIRFIKPTTMCIFGSIIYQACLAIATYLGVPSAYNKLIMAVLFTIALVGSNALKKGESRV
ncbi:MAG: ABC transporter permease [Faecalibacterium sp.]|nr:ABC transporter permease [Ruminococcus sp.]MCM1391640.1 ABC transporter permease [Ruminococcus sp.]MCM1485751.1 ABC transporter permease [Faecalibacterium sp.]